MSSHTAFRAGVLALIAAGWLAAGAATAAADNGTQNSGVPLPESQWAVTDDPDTMLAPESGPATDADDAAASIEALFDSWRPGAR
ncbi:hypothetical protein BAY61_19105 [Prauserella marina]|uniref:Uncharacterized protein n=1 Tax=Prauserella marina TaxID=530584 RepID=A0A222VS63_9PSEU|nr:hypothetical protein [Prauserella marina]ASR36757.1 hypothetical protein BAY61_19105 [Prauserella marina]PWV80353.1 hypothetical protein DES30_103444 [Prauserella marina]SDD52454.1 hypothetical protein SAMN05421630_109229 [Prauserella marina]